MSTMRELNVRPERDFQTEAGGVAAAIPHDDASGPLQLGAMLIGGLAIAFIIVNAAFLQSHRHPAPMFQTRSHGAIVSDDVPVKSADRVPTRPAAGGPGKIQKIQSLLQRHGYDVGVVDGVFGARTQTAIMEFERDRGYPQTGRVTPLLLKRLNRRRAADVPKPVTAPSSKAPAATSVPKATDASRDDIVLVQRALSDLGYGPIDIDGVLGSQTAQAIQRFELDRGMPITGNIGDRIVAELVLIGGVKPIAKR